MYKLKITIQNGTHNSEVRCYAVRYLHFYPVSGDRWALSFFVPGDDSMTGLVQFVLPLGSSFEIEESDEI